MKRYRWASPVTRWPSRLRTWSSMIRSSTCWGGTTDDYSSQSCRYHSIIRGTRTIRRHRIPRRRANQKIQEHSSSLADQPTKLMEISRVETPIGVCRISALGPRVRGRVRLKAYVFIALCLRLAFALANHHRENDVGSPTITL